MTDTICMGQSPSEGSINFLYSCVFSKNLYTTNNFRVESLRGSFFSALGAELVHFLNLVGFLVQNIEKLDQPNS